MIGMGSGQNSGRAFTSGAARGRWCRVRWYLVRWCVVV